MASFVTIFNDIMKEPPFDFDASDVRLTKINVNDELVVQPVFTKGRLEGEYRALHQFFSKALRLIEAGKSKESILKGIYTEPDCSVPCIRRNGTKSSVNRKEGKGHSEFEICKDLNDSNINVTESEHYIIPANCNNQYIEKKVIDELINTTRTSFEKPNRGTESANVSRFLLLGEVGIGKSQYLNYLYSAHHRTINGMGVIWVRIDLTKDYLRDLSLSSALKFQLSRIIRSKYKEELDDLTDFLLDFPSTLKDFEHFDEDKYIAGIEEYLEPFDEDKEEPFNGLVMKGIKHYVESKYPLIYVYDGLDKIRSDKEFQQKLQEARRYIIGSEKNWNTFILVMRNSSHAEFVYHCGSEKESDTDSYLRYPSKIFRLIPVDLDKVLKRRLSFISHNWETIIKDKKVKIANVKASDFNGDKAEVDNEVQKRITSIKNRLTWISTHNLNIFLSCFLMFLHKGITLKNSEEIIQGWNENDAYNQLCSLIGTNTRRQLIVILELLEAFLLTIQKVEISLTQIIDEFTTLLTAIDTKNSALCSDPHKAIKTISPSFSIILRKSYLVIRVLLGNHTKYIHPYEYNTNDSLDEVQIQKNPLCKRERYFIYNLYHGVNVYSNKAQRYHLLAKIRLLQAFIIFGSHEDLDSIVNRVSKLFNYTKSQLKGDANELRRMRLISEFADDSRSNIPNKYTDITIAGRRMVNTVIYDFNYLRVISSDLTIPDNTQNLFGAETKKFSLKDNNVTLMFSFSRIIHLCSLISYVEKQELKVLAMNSSLSQEQWQIADKLQVAVTEAISKISARSKNHVIKEVVRRTFPGEPSAVSSSN